MGFEPTTFCMASRRSSQLSYSRACGDSSFLVRFQPSAPDRSIASAPARGGRGLPSRLLIGQAYTDRREPQRGAESASSSAQAFGQKLAPAAR
jgi:hypothetical protein